MLANRMMAAATIKDAGPSQQAYTTPGTYTFIVPAGVTSLSMVVISGGGAGKPGDPDAQGNGGGGGGLGYANNVSVSGGQSLLVQIGIIHTNSATQAPDSYVRLPNITYPCWANGGYGGNYSDRRGGAIYPGHGTAGGSGGVGGAGEDNGGGGGGGCGGYAGNGGNGGATNGSNAASNSSGGGGGGFSYYNDAGVQYQEIHVGGNGGGVGLLGSGSTGVGAAGGGYSAGGNGGTGGNGSDKLGAGGGGGGYFRNIDLSDDSIIFTEGYGGENGGSGGVRIMWGAGRSYPSNAANV